MSHLAQIGDLPLGPAACQRDTPLPDGGRPGTAPGLPRGGNAPPAFLRFDRVVGQALHAR